MNVLYSQKWAMVHLRDPATGEEQKSSVLGCNADMNNVENRVQMLLKDKEAKVPFAGTFSEKLKGWEILDAWVRSPEECIERTGLTVEVSKTAADDYRDACVVVFQEFDRPTGPGFRHFFPKNDEIMKILRSLQGKWLDVVNVFGGSVPSAEYSGGLAVPGYYGEVFWDVHDPNHGLLRFYPPSLKYGEKAPFVVRYVPTYIPHEGGNKGMRTLVRDAQGRATFATHDEAERWMLDLLSGKDSPSFKQVYGDDPKMEVRPCPCWPGHFDPRGVYFDDEEVTNA